MKENRTFDLIALGEIMLRLSTSENERLQRHDNLRKRTGGAELNTAAGAAALGLKTAVISKLPDNDLTTFARNRIRFGNVNDQYIVFDRTEDARMGVYFYEYGAYPRKPRIIYDRKNSSINKISVNDFDDSLYTQARCFHTSGITLALSPACRETAVEMIKRFKAQGTLISFDVNFRGNLWTGAEAKECIEAILPYIDIFFCSEDTARLTFLKEGDVKSIMKEFAEEYDLKMVASTQRIVHSPKSHTCGSIIYNPEEDKYYEEEPYHNIDVVDRIGSGDAYISGALYGLLKYNMDCKKALEYGNACGAMKNTVLGDLLVSDLKEIDAMIRDHQTTGRVSEMER